MITQRILSVGSLDFVFETTGWFDHLHACCSDSYMLAQKSDCIGYIQHTVLFEGETLSFEHPATKVVTSHRRKT